MVFDLPAHDLSLDSDCCLACGLPIRAWGAGCVPSTDDSMYACAEIASDWSGP